MVSELKIPGLKLIQNRLYSDDRGFFTEHYKKELFLSFGLPEFVQDNHSLSKPRVIRGLHFQTGETAQGKLVSVMRGRIWDVAVDMRVGSATFGKWEAVELTAENGLQLWIPPGFAHGFCVLGDEDADVFYKVDKYYAPQSESGIVYNDPTLDIPWPIRNPIVSAKDLGLPSFPKEN